jgi:hypothetical protein
MCAALFVAASPIAAKAQQAENSLEEKIAASADAHRYRLDYDGERFSGPGLDKLLEEARAAQFLLIGEEHGIAENPKLAGQLFTELSDEGYSNLVIEISPPMATALDQALREGGIDGLRDLFAQRGGEPAFFGMKEEAEFLAAVRATSPRKAPILWGVDYEVAGDQHLLGLLTVMKKPVAAAKALEQLQQAADAAYATYLETRGAQFLFTFSGDPSLVRAVKEAWPDHNDEAARILDTLEETLEINRLWVNGEGWASNRRRATLMRTNFLTHWASASARKAPKLMIKLGASHLVRGRNMTETFDLGTLLPELAEIEGAHAFSIFVVPGKGAMTAVLNPATWSYEPAPGKDSYDHGVETLIAASYPDAFTLIDLRPLRAMVGSRIAPDNVDLARIVHGFDMMLVMTGGAASAQFDHPPPPEGLR